MTKKVQESAGFQREIQVNTASRGCGQRLCRLREGSAGSIRRQSYSSSHELLSTI